MSNIEISHDEKGFILNCDPGVVLTDRRLMLSLKRLNYNVDNNKLNIPFSSNDKIKLLEEIKSILDKFGFNYFFSNLTANIVSDYIREVEGFGQFSEKARKIRNNEFKDNLELVNEFNEFQEILKQKLHRRLYKLQLLSSFHMAFAQNSCNFAVPGAGKTSIVYGAYAYLRSLPINHPKHVDKLIIIGPLSSFGPWENEYKKCFGSDPKIQRLSGDSTITKKQKINHLYSGDPAEITLIYHGYVSHLENEIKDFLKKNKTMVVVDEAHRIKNSEGVWGISAVEIAKYANSRVVLTGTPLPNGYEDLYNLYQFIYPYNFKDILKVHFSQLQDMSKGKSDNEEKIKTLIDNVSPYFIRIKKKDLGLPPIKETAVFVEMDDAQKEIYDFVESKYVQLFKITPSGTLKDLLNKAKLIRLRQAAINPSLLNTAIKENLAKDDPINDLLYLPEEFQSESELREKIALYDKLNIPPKYLKTLEIIKENILPQNNGKVVIWTIFVQNAKKLQRYLSENSINAELLIGEIETTNREIIIEKFNNPKNTDFQVIIANPFSVAESISLHQGCHNAIYIERDYNCSNFLQSKDRIHRYGLSENQITNYYYVISKGTIDEIIDAKLKLKVERMEHIINDEIPLFSRVNDTDETDLIQALIESYAGRI